LLKLNPLVSSLSLFDIVNTPGIVADLSHICTGARITGEVGSENMDKALTGVDVVVIPAGVPRKPGMTRDDLFNTNASIVKGIAESCARSCPNACFLIISNPVNSTVPIFSEILKKAGVYNPRKLFGVTTLDVVRARTFVAENQGFDVYTTNVTVVGGHAGETILPLLSQVKKANFSQESIEALTKRIQFGGDEVVKAKNGGGSATLSMAFAGADFTSKVLRALNGEKNIKECTFVDTGKAEMPFFSSPVTIGTNGVETIHDITPLSDFEKAGYEKMKPELLAQIEKGIKSSKQC